MLVLSRKVGERIRIGDSVTVTVVRLSGGGVRLGIEAPAEMPVIREELHRELEESDQRAQGKGADSGDESLGRRISPKSAPRTGAHD